MSTEARVLGVVGCCSASHNAENVNGDRVRLRNEILGTGPACALQTQPVRKSQLTEPIQSYTRALIGTDSMTSSTGTIWNSAWSTKAADASNAAAESFSYPENFAARVE